MPIERVQFDLDAADNSELIIAGLVDCPYHWFDADPQAHIWQLPARFVGTYAEQDPVSTLLLFESLSPVLDREKTRDAYRLEIDLLPMVHAMRKRGIRVDTARAEEVRDLMLAKRDAVLKELSDKHGARISMTTVESHKQLAAICDGYGLSYPRTEKGNASFKAGLSGWMDKHPHWLFPGVANARRYDSSATFVETIVDHVQSGRVYGEIHPHKSEEGGARTSRFSYSHPALQQTPKHHEELAPLIRGLYLPEPGETWASCDLSQQEFRMIVHYAVRKKLPGATEMRDEYIRNPRLDIHQATADRSTGVLNRHGGKTLNFASIYGLGDEKYAVMNDLSLEEARKRRAAHNEAMPFVAKLTDLCKQLVWRDGYLPLLDGARMHFNQWVAGIGKWKKGAGPCSREEADRRTHDPGHPWYRQQLYRADVHKALNSLIQSSSARYTKMWMLDVWREGITPMLQMHDSLDLSVSSAEQAEMVARLGEKVIELAIPMVVDVKYGRTWADATHTWDERHVVTGSHVEAAREMPDDRARVTRGSPKFSSVSDEASDSGAAENVATDVDPLPWDGNSSFETAPPEPPHICIHCKLNPPDGTERVSSYSGAWLHERCEGAFINARMAEEGIASERSEAPPQQSEQSSSQDEVPPNGGDDLPPGGSNGGNGTRKSTPDADDDDDENADEPFSDTYLLQQGYKLARVFDYTLADATPLYQQNRYELKKGYTPSKKRPRKRFLPHRKVDEWHDVTGAGDRRVIYNWPAVMRAGPGSTVFVTEGEANAEALIGAGLLATTVLSHKWTPECVAALAERHLIILQDHDKKGEQYAAAAQRKLALTAASTRIVPTSHLWKHLSKNRDLRAGDDVEDWIKLGGDVRKLLDICRKIAVVGSITLESMCATDVEIEDYEWMWPGRLALKKIALIVGLPDEGKGLVLSDIAARITRGSPWPCDEGVAPIGNVILLTAEDDIADTIVPRLMAGADLARVTIIKMAREMGKERMFSLLSDLQALRQTITGIGDVAVVMIDPVSAYLGIGKVDSFRATDVRAMLGPLKVLAEELRVSILGIMHFNKKTDVTNVLLRISDSHAYGAAARHVYGVINDPDNQRRLFVKGKNNIARYEQKTLAFGIDEREVGTDKKTGKPIRRPYVVWHGEPVDITATEALQAASENKSPSARDKAKRFLTDLLQNGPVASKDVHEAAKENGISPATLRRAADGLGVDIKKDGPLNEKKEITWRWHLPQGAGTDQGAL